MEGEVVALGAAGVLGQQLCKEKALRLQSLPSLLSGYIHVKVGGAEEE